MYIYFLIYNLIKHFQEMTNQLQLIMFTIYHLTGLNFLFLHMLLQLRVVEDY